jgi:hypothetical protein
MALKTEARKPLYAVVGAGDLAVENIKDLPTQVVAQATTILPKTTAFVAEIPGKVTGLPILATSLTGKAFTAYGDLVERGEKLVRSIRRGSATQTARAQVKTAKSQTKAATTSTTKAAKATAKAVEDAAGKIG